MTLNTMIGQAGTALEAFSRQSSSFDAIDADNPIIARIRSITREAALRHMKPGDRLLELNAGTGLDAFHFATLGIRVLATDAAPGMVARMASKRAARPELPIEVMACSFHEIQRLGDRRVEHVFSNFGGLNCSPSLDQVLRAVDRMLLPGGTCTLVIMPRFSPWEVLSVIKGNFKLAFRRFRRGGTDAHLEGIHFDCHYYSPTYVQRHLGKGYRTIQLRALSLLTPPPHHETIVTRFPRLYRWLDRWEERLAHRWPFRAWGDHFLITLRKT
jgi:ubiquinone/menaquinone biosynthesis C-methylase UbiE